MAALPSASTSRADDAERRVLPHVCCIAPLLIRVPRLVSVRGVVSGSSWAPSGKLGALVAARARGSRLWSIFCWTSRLRLCD